MHVDRILDVGHNLLTEVHQLRPLENIKHLNLSYNRLKATSSTTCNPRVVEGGICRMSLTGSQRSCPT